MSTQELTSNSILPFFFSLWVIISFVDTFILYVLSYDLVYKLVEFLSWQFFALSVKIRNLFRKIFYVKSLELWVEGSSVSEHHVSLLDIPTILSISTLNFYPKLLTKETNRKKDTPRPQIIWVVVLCEIFYQLV